MKKLVAFLLVFVMCLSLAACGPDRQPAIDAYNKASDAFNEVANAINEDIESYSEEVITVMNEMADVLNQHKEKLEGSDDITEEQLNEMIEWYGTVEDWAAQMKKDFDL